MTIKYFLSASAMLLLPVILFAEQRTIFERDFAPSESWVKKPEADFRNEICLNGSWQFQPAPLPGGYQWNKGVPPQMPLPKDDAWEITPLKVPSPWNINTWGNGRNAGAGTERPYYPDSVYEPEYPKHWDGVPMAWLRRSVDVPESWNGKVLLLHFEAVSGMCEVFVNGKKVGENFGRFLPFDINATESIQCGKTNEILIGIRSLRLFDKVSEKYAKMRTPYPPGSNMDNINGIWQDVFLLALPPVCVEDVFVKPLVHQDKLEAEITVKNNTKNTVSFSLAGNVFEWFNKAPQDNVLDAPEPQWELGNNAVLQMKQSKTAELPAGQSIVLTLSTPVGKALKFWSMDEPNLYVLLTELTVNGKKSDVKYTRFGWREFRIAGKELQLNGKAVQLFGDLLHPFGPFINSRRYVWSWYKMVKDMHGNAVRPHAQPHPQSYLDLADEMGLAVLDETALFGSSIQLNFEEPEAWNRFTEHYKRLILRDRNHPSVFGWSWGNELFAIFIYDKNITPEQTELWYKKLADYGKEGMKYDSTRNWFSCDGDDDFRGAMPVWNKHFGHGTDWKNHLPKDLDKPLMVGEQGGTYYARPEQLAVFNGNRAYQNYRGRNEALAADVYQNLVEIAKPNLSFFSPAETAWFGLEHLNFGYNHFERLPNQTDGVFFKPFEEGKPGLQIGRLPPYVCTFNPGWDKTLPLYKPLPMFDAQKAALDPDGTKKWEMPNPFEERSVDIMCMPANKVLFLGDSSGELFKRLKAIGVPVELPGDWLNEKRENSVYVLIDGCTFKEETVPFAEKAHRTIVVFRTKTEIPKALQFLGDVKLVERTATQLKSVQPFYYAQGFKESGLYFAEEPEDRQIIKCAFDGGLPKEAKVYYTAADTDWTLFNDVPEAAKCAAVVLYEALQKPSGIAAVDAPAKGFVNNVLLTACDVIPSSPKNKEFWKMLLYGVEFAKQKTDAKPADDKEHNLLLNGPKE